MSFKIPNSRGPDIEIEGIDVIYSNGVHRLVMDLAQSGFASNNSLQTTVQNAVQSSGYVTLNEIKNLLQTSGYIKQSNLIMGSGVQSIGISGPNISVNVSGGAYTRHTKTNLPWNAVSLQSVSGLEYPIGPGEVICGEAYIFFTCANAATGVALALNGPANPNTVLLSVQIPTTATAIQNGAATTYDTKIIGTAGLATTLCAYMNFFVINGVNPGILVPRMASEGTTIVTVLKGSYAKYTRV